MAANTSLTLKRVTPARALIGTVCEGGDLNLTATGGNTYSWAGPNFTSMDQNPVITGVTAAHAGAYTVYVSALGCDDMALVSVTVNNSPVATASSNSPVSMGNDLELFATGGGTYNWTGPNGFTSTDQNPVLANTTAAADGIYTVTVSNGTCSATATVTVSILVPGPLVGPYTINQNAPATSTNFTSFPSAANMLNTYGVSGPVTITVVTGTSPYVNQQLLLGAIPGASATNNVTIFGNNEEINLCTNDPFNRDIIRLDGTNHVRLENLTINATCGLGWGIHLLNGADNNTLIGNTINVSTTNAALSNFQGIIATNSFTYPYTNGNAANNLQVIDNTVNGGYNGICIFGDNTTRSTGLTISGNTVNNAFMVGVFVMNNDDATLHENTVNMRAGNIKSTGIVYQFGENGYTITANKVLNAGIMGVYAHALNQTTMNRGLVANNMIGGGFQNTNVAYGIQFNFAHRTDVYYNSIHVDNAATGAALFIPNHFSTHLSIMNNSFAYTGGGTGYAMASSAHVHTLQQDYNNYHAVGARFVRYFNADRNSLTDLQLAAPGGQDMNSITVNPLYTSAANLYIPFNSPLVGAGTAVANVLVDIDGSARPAAAPAIGAHQPSSPRLASSEELDVTVYPNPFRNELMVQIESAQAGQVQLVLTDLMGRQIMTRVLTVEAGSVQMPVQVDAQLAQGVYLLQVRQGDVSSQFRVVKQ